LGKRDLIIAREKGGFVFPSQKRLRGGYELIRRSAWGRGGSHGGGCPEETCEGALEGGGGGEGKE